MDDHPINLKVMVGMLVRLGCDPCAIETASNGCIGVELHQAQAFDLIFMDCHMPVMDGFQASLRIRALEHRQGLARSVPIIAFSADVTMNVSRIVEAGMQDFLVKPFTLVELNALLNKFHAMPSGL
ncbi:MAG: response regulator [Magnetococcales bacterium]|nr:response regulator [Magnetococcales bacterium]